MAIETTAILVNSLNLTQNSCLIAKFLSDDTKYVLKGIAHDPLEYRL